MLIDDLPTTPFVAWDWDETLSTNGDTLDPSYQPLLDHVRDLGLKQVIISGRYPTAPPIPDLGLMPIITIHTINTPRYDFFNAKRFKLWVMRLPEVRQNMICYVDADLTTIRVLGTRGIPAIPPTMLRDFLDKYI
jgi:hypothetical protein